MKTHCSVANIFTLDLANISDFTGIMELILPFFNEFANLFNIVFFLPVLKFDLYPHHDTKFKLFFDVIALSGVCLNVAKKTQTFQKNTRFAVFFVSKIYILCLDYGFFTLSKAAFSGVELFMEKRVSA